MTSHPKYNYPESLEAIRWIAGRPVWVVISIACFAHRWAHLEEIALLAIAARASATSARQAGTQFQVPATVRFR